VLLKLSRRHTGIHMPKVCIFSTEINDVSVYTYAFFQIHKLDWTNLKFIFAHLFGQKVIECVI